MSVTIENEHHVHKSHEKVTFNWTFLRKKNKKKNEISHNTELKKKSFRNI